MPLPDPTGVTRLVVAYAFPPYVDTSGIVAAKRVVEHGAPVDLIQNSLAKMRTTDPGLARIGEQLIAHRAELSAPALFGSWKSMTTFVQAGQAQVAAWESAGRHYDSLYSRAHFTASHLLAGVLKADRPTMEWEAEFSDVLSRKVDGQRRAGEAHPGWLVDRISAEVRRRGIIVPEGTRVFEWAEILSYVLADRLIFTNAAQVDIACAWSPLPELIPFIRGKAVVQHHPAPPAELYHAVVSDVAPHPAEISIGYFGNISAGNGLRTVLDALSASRPEVRRRFRLWVFTPAPDDVTAQAEQLGIDEVVTARPFVPYLEMLNLLRRMDVLLVSDHARPPGQPRNPYLLAKWSDYKGSGTPVWGLVDPGSTLSEQRLAYSSPLDHVTAAMKTLIRITHDHQRPADGEPASPQPTHAGAGSRPATTS